MTTMMMMMMMMMSFCLRPLLLAMVVVAASAPQRSRRCKQPRAPQSKFEASSEPPPASKLHSETKHCEMI
jgi:hypothetical protein